MTAFAGPVVALKVQGVINPVVSEYVEDGLNRARERGASAVLIELDTPGGLLEATRTTISAMINSPVPVIVYVAPRGARATSAGVFITLAADVAAMAPETHIGAAHPVTVGGSTPARDKENPEKGKASGEEDGGRKEGSAMEEKMVSDAAAYIRALASERGRNADWAERAVRESVSLTAAEAVREKVADLVAETREELFKAVDGRAFRKAGRALTLDMKGAVVEEFPMSFARRFLHALAHPNVAYILMTIGIYGLIYELSSPGIGLGGILGFVCLLLAFFSLQVLPLNMVGVTLMGAGIALLIAELFTPAHGVLSVGGLIAFAAGSFMMIDVTRGIHFPRVSPSVILPTVGVTAAFFGIAVRKAWEARRARPRAGAEVLVGAEGVVKEPLGALGGEGLVFLNGELWTAESEEPIPSGERVVVTGREGNILFVRKSSEKRSRS